MTCPYCGETYMECAGHTCTYEPVDATDPETGDPVTKYITLPSQTIVGDPETGKTITTTTTVTDTRDEGGDTIKTETTTTTATADPSTDITTTTTVTETLDGEGNVTGTVTDTVSVCSICGATGNWTVCPNTDLCCPLCGENIHGVTDHVCKGVPEDPTQADPGASPAETGVPDTTPYPEEATFYFNRVNHQAIANPVGATYIVDLPMSVYVASTTGTCPGAITLYLHCVPDEIISGATYTASVTSVKLKSSYTIPTSPLQLFGRNLYPNMSSSKGVGESWDSGDEFLLILSTDPDTADAITEVDNCCSGVGCRYHIRVKFRDGVKPGR